MYIGNNKWNEKMNTGRSSFSETGYCSLLIQVNFMSIFSEHWPVVLSISVSISESFQFTLCCLKHCPSQLKSTFSVILSSLVTHEMMDLNLICSLSLSLCWYCVTDLKLCWFCISYFLSISDYRHISILSVLQRLTVMKDSDKPMIVHSVNAMQVLSAYV